MPVSRQYLEFPSQQLHIFLTLGQVTPARQQGGVTAQQVSTVSKHMGHHTNCRTGQYLVVGISCWAVAAAAPPAAAMPRLKTARGQHSYCWHSYVWLGASDSCCAGCQHISLMNACDYASCWRCTCNWRALLTVAALLLLLCLCCFACVFLAYFDLSSSDLSAWTSARSCSGVRPSTASWDCCC